MALMIVNPSPGARFRSNPTWVNQHRDLIVSDAFVRACDHALLEYQGIQVRQNDSGNAAMAMGFKIQGAFELIQTLRMLSESPKQPTPVPPPQLDHST